MIKLKELGNRMAMLRNHNNLKQKDIAKILNEQTAMRVEMNAIFNMMILKHDRDYKKLEYQISKLADDAGMNYLV